MTSQDPSTPFTPFRPKLFRVAYRMLGSVADAEDVLQEAYLRWHDADRAGVQEPEAFLCRIVTRLCLDHLKSACSRREVYIGSWLPEPLVETAETEVDDITLPLLLALERLSPLEHPLAGLDEAIRLFETLLPVFQAGMSRMVRYAFVNGLPGFVSVELGDVVQTTALDITDGRIAGIYVVRNPEKMRHLADYSVGL